MKKTVLLTGGAGFIAHKRVRTVFHDLKAELNTQITSSNNDRWLKV